MKALIKYTSDWYDKKTRTEDINSIEELLELQKKEGHSLIIDTYTGKIEGVDFSVEVYDDYRE